MNCRSLRLRLMLLAALSIGATLSFAGLVLVLIFERHLERRVAQELEQRLTELATLFEVGPDGTPELRREPSDPRYRQPYGGAYWQIGGSDGTPALRSRSLWDQTLETGPSAPTTEAVTRLGPNGSTLYVLEREVTLGADWRVQRNYRLSVALDHAEIAELRASFGLDVAAALLLIGVVLFVGAWLQSTLGLQPLRLMRKQLKLIRYGRLSRLPGRFPAEVEPLAQDLNRLLDRQDELISKARQRAGDLAHGLKTPLAILSAEARTLAQRGLGDSADALREQISAMRRHVERELARARTRGASTGSAALADVPGTVERLFGLMRRMPRGDGLEWLADLPPGLCLRMDPDDLGEVLGNLVDNARKWARSRVLVSAAVEGDRVTLSIADDGPGIPALVRGRLLERGERGLGSGEGSGLGLAIVTDVLAEYGARLTIGDDGGQGCRIGFAAPGWIAATDDSSGDGRELHRPRSSRPAPVLAEAEPEPLAPPAAPIAAGADGLRAVARVRFR